MNVDMSPRTLFSGVIAATNLNAHYPSASGIEYKAEDPEMELVVHSATGATIGVIVEGSIDGTNWTTVQTLSATSSSGTPNAVAVGRPANALFLYWRATITSASGDAAATVDCALLG